MKKANNKKCKLHPLVEVIPYSKLNEKDIIIIRCKKGQENEALKAINSELISLIKEKDLRILALTPDFPVENLSIVIKNVSEFN